MIQDGEEIPHDILTNMLSSKGNIIICDSTWEKGPIR